MADLASRIGSSWCDHTPTLAAAITVVAFVIGMTGPAAHADEIGAKSTENIDAGKHEPPYAYGGT